MAGGSNSCTPATSLDTASSVDENRPFSQGKHCSVCNEATKGHLGPYGPGRCIRGIVIKLTERVDELEKAGKIKDKQLRELERLSAERQEALLATIQVLDEQIKHMEKRQESSSKFCESTDCDEPLDFSGSSMTYRPPLMGKEQANSTITVQSSESKNEVQCASVYLKGCSLSSAMDAKSEEEGQKDDMLQQRTVPAPPETENFVACTHALQDATIRQDVSGRSTSESQSKIAAGQKYSTVTSNTDPRSQQRETDTNHFREKSSDTEEGWQRVHSRGKRLRKFHFAPPPSRLYGSDRITTKAFHLSGIGLDCCTGDVVQHCRDRGVVTTGCLFIRTRVWGTQSAKLFVSMQSAAEVTKKDFWPNLIKCREWESSPPRRLPPQ